MKTDYVELENEPVLFEDRQGFVCKGVVTGCDYHIGITIQSDDEDKTYLLCTAGPNAPNFTNYPGAMEEHKAVFFSTVRQIKKGLVTTEMLDRVVGALRSDGRGAGTSPSAETCPFSQ